MENRRTFNQILNVLDPFKDAAEAFSLGAEQMTLPKEFEAFLLEILHTLFFPDRTTLPQGINLTDCSLNGERIRTAMSRLVATPLKLYFQHEFQYPVRTSDLLRVEHSPGGVSVYLHDLFVAQDSGRGDLVEKPTYIITPGSI